MFDRIVTVTLNPSIDATIWLPVLDFNEPVVCKRRKDYPGGKGINVSRVLSALNIDNLALGITGSENNQKLSDLLEQDNVKFKLIENPGAVRENLSIVFPDSRLMKVNFEGFETLEDTLKKLKTAIVEAMEGADAPLVVFAGSLPKRVFREDYCNLIELAKDMGAMIALDNDFFSLDELKRIKPHIIKPNHVELAHIFGLESIPLNQLPEYAIKLSDFAEHILLSMGGGGLMYCSKNKIVMAKVPSVEVKSTIGAGDSTLAGFIASLYCNEDVLYAVRYAAACGTASVKLEGTQAVNEEQVLEILPLIELN